MQHRYRPRIALPVQQITSDHCRCPAHTFNRLAVPRLYSQVATSELALTSAANQQERSHLLEEALLQGVRVRTLKTVLLMLRMLRIILTT